MFRLNDVNRDPGLFKFLLCCLYHVGLMTHRGEMAAPGIMSSCKAWRWLKVQRTVLLTSPGPKPSHLAPLRIREAQTLSKRRPSSEGLQRLCGTQINRFCHGKSFFRDFSTRPRDQGTNSVNSIFIKYYRTQNHDMESVNFS